MYGLIIVKLALHVARLFLEEMMALCYSLGAFLQCWLIMMKSENTLLGQVSTNAILVTVHKP